MTPAELICPRCGKANPADAKFCLECGNGLTDAAPRVGREERKVVSVLFADLVGFTSHAEQLDPEEVRALLAPYHAAVRADLERFGGTVEKFIGDAVMALFGAPVAHEDDPERAVRAALAMRDTVLAEGRLHLRIGITTGEALVALEARPQAGEGMAAGDVVNTAARLQAAAPVDGILVDETTWRATSRMIDYRSQDPVTVKGKAEPIAIWEAVSARARFGIDVRQLSQTPLVGRSRELELVAAARDRAWTEGEPQLVTLVGVPGIGKSRLVWELFGQVDAGDGLVAWRQGRSLPYAESISFWALGEIVKAEAGVLETDTAGQAAAKLAKAVAALELEPADAEWIERHLRPLVGVEAGVELRGDHRGEAFAAWRRFIEALAERRPLVLVFEDLQWADDGLLDFVDHLVDWVTGVPLLVVGTARPELLSRRPGWGGGKPNALTISLAPLSESDTARLVAGLVEQAVIPDSVRQAVLSRAEGNPLYAEEFARLIAEHGRVDELPETVQGIIAARLDGVERDEKRLLQDAAVVGKVFWSGALTAMSGEPRTAVEERLHALERRQFVRRERRSSVADETEYAFSHILVRDVAYGQIPRAERAERHARAAAWIESLGRTGDTAELLAQHYLAAIELAHAAGAPVERYTEGGLAALRVAAERAVSLNAFAMAARYFGSALELMAADDPARPHLLFGYGKALRISAEGGGELLAEAEAALREAGDRATAGEAAVLQAELAWFAGDGERTSDHLARAAELVDGLDASYSKAYVLSDLSRYRMLRDEHEQAIRLGQQALEIANTLGLDEIRAHTLNNIGTSRVSGGNPGGIADLEAALEIATAIRSPEAGRVMNNLSSSLDSLGEVHRAREMRREGLALAQEFGNASVARFIRSVMVQDDYDSGRWDAALSVLDELIGEAERAGGHAGEAWTRADRGRIRLARDDVDGALDEAERALLAAHRAGDPQVLLAALGFKAWLMTQLGRDADAGRLLDELLGQRQTGESAGSELAMMLILHGRREDLERIIAGMPENRWRNLLSLHAAGELGTAVDEYEALGLPTRAALLRLDDAERLFAAGCLPEALAQVEKALPFWRSVAADRFIRRGEQLQARLESAGARSATTP